MRLRFPSTQHATAAFVAVAVLGVVLTAASATPAAAAPTRPYPYSTAPQQEYTWPVDAPVVDRFRPPPTPYAAGNRGIDLDTDVGQPVLAAAPGLVVFAGAVGRTLHVVVLHAGGLRTTYSFLRHVEVRRGQRVVQGDVIGRAGDTLHFGVRVGASYLDPLSILGVPPSVHPYLVPDDGGRDARGIPYRALVRRHPGALRRLR